MSECNHDCSSCGKSCDERAQSFLEKPNELSHIKKVFAVMSGKGGVGKSLVTCLLASALRKRGYNVAVLDADITGPSVPKMFGIKDKAVGSELGIMPVLSKGGIQTMSINLLLENDTDPVVWRGPVIAGAVKQFWTDVIWNDVDYMFVDMPPGTGDVPLTVFQSLPVDGIIAVTSPQELVGLIVQKAKKMADLLHKPILGLVENMSYFVCPNCSSKHYPFGKTRLEETAAEYGGAATARLPINPELARLCDAGKIEEASVPELDDFVNSLLVAGGSGI